MKEWIDRIKKITLRDHKPCCQPEALVQVFLESTSNKEKFRLLDHIFSCPECCTEFPRLKELWAGGRGIVDKTDTLITADDHALVKKIADQEIKNLKKLKRAGRRFFLPSKPVVVIASGIFLVALVTLFVIVNRQGDDALMRTSDSGYFEVFSPLDSVSSFPILFRWFPIKESEYYTLEILDKSLETVYRKDQIKTESFVLTVDILPNFFPGQTYFWKVISHFENGQTTESEFGKFRVLSSNK